MKNHKANVKNLHQMDKEGVKPAYVNGAPKQPKDVGQILSAWDRMTVAKRYPGQLDTEYCAGMNLTPLPTICASVSSQVREAYVPNELIFLPLGSKDYTVIMWCSSATLFHGPGGTGAFSTEQKLGGFYIA